MSLCRLMVSDYLHGTGRYCEVTHERFYNNDNLKFGIEYSQGLLEEGFTHEPITRFDLRGFIEWAKARQKEEQEVKYFDCQNCKEVKHNFACAKDCKKYTLIPVKRAWEELAFKKLFPNLPI